MGRSFRLCFPLLKRRFPLVADTLIQLGRVCCKNSERDFLRATNQFACGVFGMSSDEETGIFRCTWSCRDPNGSCSKVYVCGSFSGWKTMLPLQQLQGIFALDLRLPFGVYRYRFFVDGEWSVDHQRMVGYDDAGLPFNFVKIGPVATKSTVATIEPSAAPVANLVQSPASKPMPHDLLKTQALGSLRRRTQSELNLSLLPFPRSEPSPASPLANLGSRSHDCLAVSDILNDAVASSSDIDSANVEIASRMSISRTMYSDSRAGTAGFLVGDLRRSDSADSTSMERRLGVSARAGKMVFVMVGLPARGKTYTAKKIELFLSWMGHNVRLFNVGERRRKNVAGTQDASFFDVRNEEAYSIRKQLAEDTMREMFEWLESDGHIAIFDATNTTKERRHWVQEYCVQNNFAPIFIEIICTDQAMIEANILAVKLKSPDYVSASSAAEAISDFKARIKHYEDVYEPIDDDESEQHLAYVKLINSGRQIMSNNLRGFIPWRVLQLIANICLSNRPIYLSRHGESEYNVLGKLGGDSALSARGLRYAENLAAFMRSDEGLGSNFENLHVWTSSLNRTIMTAKVLGLNTTRWRALDEIDAGRCDGLTYEQIKEEMPTEYLDRQKNKLCYRYPQGESYQDLIHRLEGVIVELERHPGPLLIVSHQAVLRVLIAYCMRMRPADAPDLDVPLHVLIKLTPSAYGCDEQRHILGPGSGS
jgi:broad specificity phosphatase PhoE/adenylylsulfate kinase-like enzyme